METHLISICVRNIGWRPTWFCQRSRKTYISILGGSERDLIRGYREFFYVSKEFRMADGFLWSAALHTSMVMDAIRKWGRMRTADIVAWLRGLPARCRVMNPTVTVCFQNLFLLICQPRREQFRPVCGTLRQNGYGDECQPKATVIAIHFWKHRFGC